MSRSGLASHFSISGLPAAGSATTATLQQYPNPFLIQTRRAVLLQAQDRRRDPSRMQHPLDVLWPAQQRRLAQAGRRARRSSDKPAARLSIASSKASMSHFPGAAAPSPRPRGRQRASLASRRSSGSRSRPPSDKQPAQAQRPAEG